MTRVLVTGAAGFVGSTLVPRLMADGKFCVHAAVREGQTGFPPAVTVHRDMDLAAATDWSACLTGVDCVVHLAARVHVMHDGAADPLTEFRKINVEGTLALARQAAAAGVRRFIYLSSIKVNGESTEPGKPFVEDDLPAPREPYGISKLEAEQGLISLGREAGMAVVIIRPPLVYGPGVKGNFLTMLRWLARGYPLPLGSIANRRSLVSVHNLVDLIVACISHPDAANQTFLVSDGDDLSTTDLFRRLGGVLGNPAQLLPVPAWFLVGVGAALGKREMMRRLCGSLQVDIAKSARLLGWSPPFGVDEGLKAAASHFLRQSS